MPLDIIFTGSINIRAHSCDSPLFLRLPHIWQHRTSPCRGLVVSIFLLILRSLQCKAFLVAAHGSMDVKGSMPLISMEPWATPKKALHQCGSDISPCPGSYPRAACPDFHIGCRLCRELSPYLCTASSCLNSTLHMLFWTTLSPDLTHGNMLWPYA